MRAACHDAGDIWRPAGKDTPPWEVADRAIDGGGALAHRTILTIATQGKPAAQARLRRFRRARCVPLHGERNKIRKNTTFRVKKVENIA
jgi:hypothetical protein